MACFVVPAVEAMAVTVAEKVIEKREGQVAEAMGDAEKTAEIPLSRKLKWLTYMLWGGAVLLMFEHVWHGEVTPWFPFLTAMSDPEDAAEMLREMATVGVSMMLLTTAIWFVICKIADIMVKKPVSESVKGSEI